MKFKRYALVSLCVLAFFVAGCKDAYHEGLSASAKIADTVHEAVQVETDYYNQGLLTDAEKARDVDFLINVTNANQKFKDNITLLHKSGVTGIDAYVQAAQALVNAVPTDPLAFQYKSADAQAKFKKVLSAVKTALAGVELAIQSAKQPVTQ